MKYTRSFLIPPVWFIIVQRNNRSLDVYFGKRTRRNKSSCFLIDLLFRDFCRRPSCLLQHSIWCWKQRALMIKATGEGRVKNGCIAWALILFFLFSFFFFFAAVLETTQQETRDAGCWRKRLIIRHILYTVVVQYSPSARRKKQAKLQFTAPARLWSNFNYRLVPRKKLKASNFNWNLKLKIKLSSARHQYHVFI